MTIQTGSDGGENTSRIVLREVKPQLVSLSMDSLYLVVEYPHVDVFQDWASGAVDLNDPELYQGIPYQDMIVRRGGNGYKLSVWDGDARLYLTDRVNDQLEGTSAEGQGMGVMLQLGPKWLHQYGKAFAPKALRENVAAQLILFGLKDPGQYPMRINRMDIALDVLGWDVSRFSLDLWRNNWVGYAKPRHFHFAPRTGQLTGFSVGSYKGNIRFKVYDKVLESEQSGTSRFWRSVWGVGEDDLIDVARCEWSIRCHQARFTNLRYLAEYTFEGFMGLLNYVSLTWGSLRIPQEDNRANKARWPLHPLWVELRSFIDDYSFGYERFVRPAYALDPDINADYLDALAGWLASFQARDGVEKGKDGPSSLAAALSRLVQEGYTIEDIMERAWKKWRVFSRLARGHDVSAD
jgi:hypothetical protein